MDWSKLPLDIIRKIVLMIDDMDVKIAFGNVQKINGPHLNLRFPELNVDGGSSYLFIQGGKYLYEWIHHDNHFEMFKQRLGTYHLSGCSCSRCMLEV